MKKRNKQLTLATIELVKVIHRIEGSDNLEVIHFGNCNSVVRKDIYLVNQPVIVVRAEAVIPPELAIRAKITRCLKKSTVKSLTLMGQLSNCIILPIDCIPIVKFKEAIKRDPYAFLHCEVSEDLGIIPSNEFKQKNNNNFLSTLSEFIKSIWEFFTLDLDIVTINEKA